MFAYQVMPNDVLASDDGREHRITAVHEREVEPSLVFHVERSDGFTYTFARGCMDNIQTADEKAVQR